MHKIAAFDVDAYLFAKGNNEIDNNILSKVILNRSYLTHRKQFMYVNGEKSSLRDILFGVPQGSILGPLLFICYVNDIPGATALLPLLYADDTTYFISEIFT
jgi:hypothetical protein